MASRVGLHRSRTRQDGSGRRAGDPGRAHFGTNAGAMLIYADENIPFAQEFFSPFGEVRRVRGRELTPSSVRDADALLVRSVTQVDDALLAGGERLRFVGSATAGTDHVDLDALARRGVAFACAPGANAQSVVEYVLSSLLVLAERRGWDLRERQVGIVGVGQIGGRLAAALSALGVPVLLCDPLRAAADPAFAHSPFERLLEGADVLTFHVPLVREGPFATFHMLAAEQLDEAKPDCAVVNASRGAVVCNASLQAEAARRPRPRALVLDVWEHEPDVRLALLPYLELATAHIAGYSMEAKARGTEVLYRSFCALMGVEPRFAVGDFLPPPAFSELRLDGGFGPSDLPALVRLLYDVRRDDALFRNHVGREGFDWLRRSYPPRREFGALRVTGARVPDWLRALGFGGG